MKTLILLEKRTYLLKILQLFKKEQELEVTEIKKKIPPCSYHRFLLTKIADINSILSKGKPNYFIRPSFIKKQGKVVAGLKIHPDISYEVKDNFVAVKYEQD